MASERVPWRVVVALEDHIPAAIAPHDLDLLETDRIAVGHDREAFAVALEDHQARFPLQRPRGPVGGRSTLVREHDARAGREDHVEVIRDPADRQRDPLHAGGG